MKNLLRNLFRKSNQSKSDTDLSKLIDSKGNEVHQGTYRSCMGLKKMQKDKHLWKIQKV